VSERHIKAILDEYISESEEVDLSAIRKSENFFIKKFPDAIYFGECIKNEKGKLVR